MDARGGQRLVHWTMQAFLMSYAFVALSLRYRIFNRWPMALSQDSLRSIRRSQKAPTPIWRENLVSATC